MIKIKKQKLKLLGVGLLVLVSLHALFYGYALALQRSTGLDVLSITWQAVQTMIPHLLLSVIVATVRPSTALTNASADLETRVVLILLAVMPLLEEAVFRYFLPLHLSLVFSSSTSRFISSLSFGISHAWNALRRKKSTWAHYLISISHIIAATRCGQILAKECTGSNFVAGVLVHYWTNTILAPFGALLGRWALFIQDNNRPKPRLKLKPNSQPLCFISRGRRVIPFARAPLERSHSVPSRLLDLVEHQSFIPGCITLPTAVVHHERVNLCVNRF